MILGCALLVSLLAAAPAPQALEPDLPPPVARKFVEALATLQTDPEPDHLAADVHFPTSNEEQHYLWRPTVTDLGGVLVGVGTDQNYLLAGWAKPEVLLLVDFDQAVVDVHLVYVALLRRAKNPREFIALWSWSNRKKVIELLAKEQADPKIRARVTASFLEHRPAIDVRLKHLSEVYRELKIPTFLDDPAQFQYLSALAKTGQIHAVRGDFRTGAALTDIARVATLMKLPVRVLYLSNAERYFRYTEAFRKSVRALPFDERSVVLRTVGLGSTANLDPYLYVVQSGKNFQGWLEDPKVIAVDRLHGHLVPSQTRFLYSLEASPGDPLPVKDTKPKAPPATPGSATPPKALK